MAVGEDKRSQLITQRDELIKQYVTFDGNNRVEYVYTCQTDTPDGGECTRVQYEYDGSSARIAKMKETLDTWVSATMDI